MGLQHSLWCPNPEAFPAANVIISWLGEEGYAESLWGIFKNSLRVRKCPTLVLRDLESGPKKVPVEEDGHIPIGNE